MNWIEHTLLFFLIVGVFVFFTRRRARRVGFGGDAAEPPVDAMDAEAEARHHLAKGRKIEAIKAVRDKTGMGLKEAKEYVERLEAEGP